MERLTGQVADQSEPVGRLLAGVMLAAPALALMCSLQHHAFGEVVQLGAVDQCQQVVALRHSTACGRDTDLLDGASPSPDKRTSGYLILARAYRPRRLQGEQAAFSGSCSSSSGTRPCNGWMCEHSDLNSSHVHRWRQGHFTGGVRIEDANGRLRKGI